MDEQMPTTIRNFRAVYLINRIENASATPEPSAGPGWYRHVDTVPGICEADIVRELRDRGATPLEVKEVGPFSRLLSRASPEYKYQLLQALAFQVEAGRDPASALTTVVESDTGTMREHLNRALVILHRGGTFYEALSALEFYDESVLSMLDAGERTGTMKAAVRSALAYLDSRKKADVAAKGAASALAFEVMLSAGTLVGNYAAIPAMTGGQKISDPVKAAEVASMLSQLMLANGVLLAITILAAIAGLVAWYAYKGDNLKLRRWVDKRVLRIPLLGKSILHSAVSSSTKVAAALVKSGVDMALAHHIVLKGVRVPAVRDYWTSASQQLELGELPARALNQALLEPAERVLIASHSTREQLAEALESMSKQREEQADRAAKKFGKAAFLVTLLYNGAAVLILVGAMYIQNKSMMAGMGA